jgi:Leucine-rich repeat (LRR) protein
MPSRRVLIASISLALLIGTARAQITRQERIIAGGPADSMEVRYLYLKGSNEEIGRALAEIARDRYQVKLERSSDPLRTRATRHYIEKNYPILYERMRGVAAAYGHRIDDDQWDYTGLGFTELHAACSIVHLPPQATSLKTGIVSRDYDYSTGSLGFGFLPAGMLHPTARPYLLELHPDHGYASLAMVAYDLLSGALDGINSEGLTVTMAMDYEFFDDRIEPTLAPAAGMSELQMLRLLLDTAGTAEEAKLLLLQTKQYYGFVPVHYLIADRFGNAFIWEYSHAHNKEFIIENPNQPLVMTNFSLNLHLNQGKPPSPEQAANVCKRYSLLKRELTAPPERISEEFINATHKKVDAELPQSADTTRPPVRTFWHALYYPEQRRLRISYYLHDDPVPGQSNRVRVVRSDYLEFKLSPTNQRQASPPAAALPSQVQSPAETQGDALIAQLESRGAKVKLDGTQVVGVDLSKAPDLQGLLPLLRRLPDLAELTIQTPAMDDAALAMLEGLPKLSRLNLYSASVTDEGLKTLKTLPSLRYLPIGGTKITDAGLVHIAQLTKLEYLGLRGDNITDVGLGKLGELARLNTLNLSETKVTDAGLIHLKDLGQLEVLQLSNDNVSDAGLAELAGLTKLTGLFLDGTRITDGGLGHLRSMSRLTKLNVANTAVTESGLADARKFLPFWITIQKEK